MRIENNMANFTKSFPPVSIGTKNYQNPDDLFADLPNIKAQPLWEFLKTISCSFEDMDKDSLSLFNRLTFSLIGKTSKEDKDKFQKISTSAQEILLRKKQKKSVDEGMKKEVFDFIQTCTFVDPLNDSNSQQSDVWLPTSNPLSFDLFKKCIKSSFEKKGFKITVANFDSFKVDITNLHEEVIKDLDKFCLFLTEGQNSQRFPQIKKFSVVANRGRNSPEKKQGFTSLFDLKTNLSYPQSLKNILTEINLFNTEVSSIKFIKEFVKTCSHLKSISLPIYRDGGINRDNDYEFNELDSLIKDYKATHPNMKTLNLDLAFHGTKGKLLRSLQRYPEVGEAITALYFEESTIIDEDIEFLTKNCPNLETLNLKHQKQVTDQSLVYLQNNCKNLQTLYLSNCSLTFGGLVSFAQNLPKMRHFEFLDSNIDNRISDEEFGTLVKAWPMLETLFINGNKVTDDGIKVLSESCPNLRMLEMKEATEITDVGLEFLAEKCQHITAFSLSHNRILTSKCIQIAQKWSQLEYLQLPSCITSFYGSGVDLKSLAVACPELKYLDFSECKIFDLEETQKFLSERKIKLKFKE